MSAWFFFSYARQDWDERLEKFYKRLAKEVGKAKQLSEPEAGFFDQRSIEVGDVWDAKLREALRTTRVMIAICSPTYFTREYCGKEMQVCVERLPAGAQSTAIIPVMWDRPEASRHPALEKYQFTNKDLTDIYASEGLYYIMGLKKHDDDYEEFVMKLSRKIVEAGQNRPLAQLAALRPFDQIQNPFAKTPQTSGAGAKHALFAYVAGRKEELPPALADRYGVEGKEWRPFHPDCSDPAGIMAMEVAAKQKLFYRDLPVDGSIVDRIREAEDKGEVVILLVDPWTVQVQGYEQYMRTYDKHNFDNSAVLVAWNSPDRGDPERKILRDQLSKNIPALCGRKAIDLLCRFHFLGARFSKRCSQNDRQIAE